ncbi:exopolysaccharide biosynthesis [Brachionus plicatilis]|uniref:Exopolysaccharide biosynthesis n=1 Tax=Brachionus plicatilis TaxID=10195 RepID=A0A3M7SMP4_BRAPC|nr:exopolysaccharide biosynthesis [Brachionus plicatilis]
MISRQKYPEFIIRTMAKALVSDVEISAKNSKPSEIKHDIKNKVYSDINRKKCLKKIGEEIFEIYNKYSYKNKEVHLFHIPLHRNYGDSLIWLGEEILFKKLNLTIKSYDYKSKGIKENEIIFLNGGGNFGDLWRQGTIFREGILKKFVNNTIILFPQTINYHDKELIKYDEKIFSAHKNFKISTRSKESYDFATKNFINTKTILVPDMAFMIGSLKPFSKPNLDVFILRRTDKESNFPERTWKEAYYKYFSKIKYVEGDWHDYYHIRSEKLNQLPVIRKNLVNEILSQGKIIITDRLHASIFSLLIGRPHIIINEKYKKIFNTRSTAFGNKTECNRKFLKEYYAENPETAAKMAFNLLISKNLN